MEMISSVETATSEIGNESTCLKLDMSEEHREYPDALITGQLKFRVYKNGRCIEKFGGHNLIVKIGRQRFAELIAGVSTDSVKYIGVGTGKAAASVDDKDLTNRQLFEVKKRRVEGCDAVFEWELDTSDANGLAISEFGLFTSDKKMVTHRVRVKVIEKEDDIRIEGEYRLKF